METVFVFRMRMSVKGLSLQLPGETREPLPQAYCQLCLCHGVSERHGLDALGCNLPLRPSLEALHAPGSRHISPGLSSFTSVSFNVPNPASSLY